MKNYRHKNIFNIFICTTLLIGHAMLAHIEIHLPFSPKSKTSIRIKNRLVIRKLGVEKSKTQDLSFSKSKKQELSKMLEKFAIDKAQGTDTIKNTLSSVKKSATRAKSGRTSRISLTQQQIMNEVKKEISIPHPLLSDINFNIEFLPPKGISPDELNELEKVFYSFYKRVSLQYAKSIQMSIMSAINDKPYIQKTMRNHKPAYLKARVIYDENGNAEVIKMLKSSLDDDVHRIFEEVLKKMSTIPNIARQLVSEDGKYITNFHLSINN